VQRLDLRERAASHIAASHFRHGVRHPDVGFEDVTTQGTVAVLGPGAVGGALAVPLAEAGVDVVCIARPATAAAITSQGLSLRHGSVLRTARPRAVEELDEPVDLLLVTVKATGLEDALARIKSAPAVVLPLLNGLEHVDAIRRRLDGRVLAGSIGKLEAYRNGPTDVVQTTPALLITVFPEDRAVDLLREAGLEVQAGESERAVLWEKTARLAPLAAATAITRQTLGELRSDDAWRSTLEAAVAEACAIAAADGVILSEAAQWEILDTMPAGVTTSTARDAAAGRPTELDAILGAVVRAAKRLEVRAPTLEGLLAEAEDTCRAQSH
jgi:2-dehydropantoate 2-reductase